jgi:lysozyme
MSEIQTVPNALLGIDVSHWQGQIDWVQVSEAGVKFAFIKATDGVSEDPKMTSNTFGCSGAGIPFGLYHFWRPQIDATKQAQAFKERVTEYPIVQGVTLVPPGRQFAFALDIEMGSLTEDNQQQALHFITNVQSWVGKTTPFIVYVSPSYSKFNLTDPAWLQYPLWTAHYTDLPQPNIDKWSSWMFWQRQPYATIPGISTPCDVDWFNGDATAFSKLIQLPT